MEVNITKPVLSVIDDNYDKSLSLSYHLVINISRNSASCCITDINKSLFFAVEQVDFMNNAEISESVELFEDYFNSSFFAKQKYKAVDIIISSEYYTIVPSALYHKEAAKLYLEFSTSLKFEAEIHSFFVQSIESYVIYAVPTALCQGMKKIFSDYKLLPHAGVLITESMGRYKNSKERILLAHVQNARLDLMVIENHKMIFFNSFNYNTTEDVVYYTLLVCDTLKLNPEEISFKICGEIEKKSSVYVLLYKYIRNIDFINSNQRFKYSGGYSHIPSHFFFNIINAAACV